MNREFKELRLEEIRPSKTNPRKDLGGDRHKKNLLEMAESIRRHGVLQNLLVRPDYCLGTHNAQVIAEKRREPVFWVLVAGERRWMAARSVDLETLPCAIGEFTDDDALEIQLIENLQRQDLTPLEEAESYQGMLRLVNEDGTERYPTQEALAAHLGVSRRKIALSLSLLKLGSGSRDALESGDLAYRTACEIALIPNEIARDEFAKKVLHPEYSVGPLSFAEARKLREEQYCISLKGAPWKLEDAELLPATGACTTCPHYAGNRPELFEDALVENRHLQERTCLAPACYAEKREAALERERSKAAEKGMTVLTKEEDARVFPGDRMKGDLAYDSPFVHTARRPPLELLKPEVTNAPTWGKLVDEAEEKTGMKVPRVVATDQRGDLCELVDRQLAIAAIEKAGEPIFREKTRAVGRSDDEFSRQRKAEMVRAKVQTEGACEALELIWRKLARGISNDPLWDIMWKNALHHAGGDGAWLIGKWKGLKFRPNGASKDIVIRQWAKKLTEDERRALVPIFLVAQETKWAGVKAAGLSALADFTAVNLDEIGKRAAAKLGKAEIKEQPPKKPVPAKIEKPGKIRAGRVSINDGHRAQVKKMVEEGRTGAEIAAIVGISLPSVQNIKKSLGLVRRKK